MSRIKTDLKPTVKRIASLASISPRKSESATKFPPVSGRTPSASPRHSVDSVDSKWTVDMVRGITIPCPVRETERSQTTGNIQSNKNCEPSRTNKETEKLYQKCLSLQKLISQLRDEIKVKNKTITELREQLSKNEVEYEQSLKTHKEVIAKHESKIETFYEEIKEFKEVIMQRTEQMDLMKKELEATKKECDDKVQTVMKDTDAQIDAICQKHSKELADRDAKLAFLKMQLESALNNNSRERQRQLDELTKELTRVTDETETLKAKLRSLAKQKIDDCRGCATLQEALQSKLKELREKNDWIAELLQHCQKMAIQLSRQNEFLKLCEKGKVKYIDKD